MALLTISLCTGHVSYGNDCLTWSRRRALSLALLYFPLFSVSIFPCRTLHPSHHSTWLLLEGNYATLPMQPACALCKGLCEAFSWRAALPRMQLINKAAFCEGTQSTKAGWGEEIKGSRPGENLIITDISHLKGKPFRVRTGGHCSITGEEGEGGLRGRRRGREEEKKLSPE